ncbi:FAD-dependent oxidoreductase [Rugamonas apoptosis]|uniref:FAD-dependent oxidoreductase n=1 Tax=Rugamonas apoptosis TaxID=2758570 RepID=A0A7W2F6T5_9BURK|nr:FAD-dependent oxidoreductase [Rugamonas apoptosis]MBA5686151.1 FAD-dependent oxidoreductase [Rugamonas apoptosis]
MTENVDIDVLICGAGAAGLTLAIDLARRGISFRLIEKANTPFHGSRGKGIQPRTQEVFEDLGILDRIVAVGGLYPPQRLYEADGSSTDAEFIVAATPTPAEPYQLPLMVPQFLTERVMRERLWELGHTPEFGCELIGFLQDGDVVTVSLRRGGTEQVLRTRYLVGADGGRSFVRHSLGIDFPGKTLGVRAVVADVVLTGLERDVWHRFNKESMERQIALCPLSGTNLFQLQAPVPLEGEVDLTAAGLTSMVQQRTGRSDIVIESVAWASAYGMNARLAERYRVGQVFLVGDAAHIHPPTGGQGLNTSVQDAYNLGWKLAAAIAGAQAELLESYEAERRPVAAGMLGLATKLLDSAKRGEMQRGREVHQLDLGYPESPLALDGKGYGHAVAAGGRAPDAPLRGAAGQTRRLFDLFKGPHWTLLCHEIGLIGVRARPGLHIHVLGTGGDVIDADGHFDAAYALQSPGWVLIRPDGYVAATVGGQDIDALECYLQQVGLA